VKGCLGLGPNITRIFFEMPMRMRMCLPGNYFAL
jgi:hypothetical protein